MSASPRPKFRCRREQLSLQWFHLHHELKGCCLLLPSMGMDNLASQGDTPRAEMLRGRKVVGTAQGRATAALPRQTCRQLGHRDAAEAETTPKPVQGPPTALHMVGKPPCRRRDPRGPGSFGSDSLELRGGRARRRSAPGQLPSEPMPALA